MVKLFIGISSGLLVVVLVFAIWILRQQRSLRRIKKEKELCYKAFVFLCGDNEQFLRTKLQEIEFIHGELATSEVQISSDLRVVDTAEKMLKFSLEKNNPMLKA